jgi:hypothetical protein
MIERCYVGIDKTENDEWMVVWSDQGKLNFSRPYKNTPLEIQSLVGFISEHCEKPKICLNSANPAAFNLVTQVSSIPGVEVILMSKAGLRLHLNWLPKDLPDISQTFQNDTRRAYWMACCAERMI